MNSLSKKTNSARSHQKGASLVELVLVLALICMFGAALFSLIFAGNEAYQRLETSRLVENDARVAMSYLHVRLRQNDQAGLVNSVKLSDGRTALLLTSPDSELMQTYIFFSGGRLYESNVIAGGQPDISVANVIAVIDDCELRYDPGEGVVYVKVVYGGEKRQELSTSISLRSAEEGAKE